MPSSSVIFISFYEAQQLIIAIGDTIKWVIEPYSVGEVLEYAKTETETDTLAYFASSSIMKKSLFFSNFNTWSKLEPEIGHILIGVDVPAQINLVPVSEKVQETCHSNFWKNGSSSWHIGQLQSNWIFKTL